VTDDELELAWDALLAHAPRGLFRHFRTRHVYEVTGLALSEEDASPLVLYRRQGGRVVWARPMSAFCGYAFSDELRTHVRRFEPVEGGET
jgi:hypothetical protein